MYRCFDSIGFDLHTRCHNLQLRLFDLFEKIEMVHFVVYMSQKETQRYKYEFHLCSYRFHTLKLGLHMQ